VEGDSEDSGIAELVGCPLSESLEAPPKAFQVLVMAEDGWAFLRQAFQHSQQLFGELEDSGVAAFLGGDVDGLSFEVDVGPGEAEEFSCSCPGFFAEL